MKTEKRLSSAQDVNLFNQVEIVNVDKPYGTIITEYGNKDITTAKQIIPGSYIPSAQSGEATHQDDDNMAEEITIIPSTGANKNYAVYTVIGIILLLTVAGAIYIIKKKIMK